MPLRESKSNRLYSETEKQSVTCITGLLSAFYICEKISLISFALPQVILPSGQ